MISVAVQHHPERQHLLEPLLARLGDDVDVVADPDPAGRRLPLRTYLECLRRTPPEATTRIVIQDDAWPCNGFREKAAAAIAERPDSLLCFFVPGSPGGGQNRVIRAAKEGARWALIGAGGWVPTVAVAWPVDLIEPFVKLNEGPRYVNQGADDAVLARFVSLERLAVWATVPSLVEHPDIEPSLIGRKHGAGKIEWRVAALYSDD